MSTNTPFYDQSVCFFHCTNLENTTLFYTQLGLSVALDQGACKIFRVSKDGFIGFCTHRAPPENKNGVIITLVTQQVEDMCTQLERSGVIFERPLQYNERFDITHAFLRDPDGYLVEIQRFESPDWKH